jgi:transmembrane sensor
MVNQEFKAIISRYFRGELAENEYELLTAYLRDKENADYFNCTKEEWEQQPEVDESGARNLKRLLYRLNSIKATPPQPMILRLWFQVAAVAAILTTGLFLGALFSHQNSASKPFSEQLVFETPRGQKSLVKLPDGSEVWLNAKSTLVYSTFSDSHRQVELKGEAFFNISRNEHAPFVVKTDQCEVEVLGTSFNVMAYNEFGRQEITLMNGKVVVHADELDQEIRPGQAVVLKDHQMKVVEVRPADASGWVESKLNFRNIPLSELMKRLENWYDVDITLVNKSGREVSFTGTFKNEETIWQVLDAIQVYTPIRYKKTDLRQIRITIE